MVEFLAAAGAQSDAASTRGGTLRDGGGLVLASAGSAWLLVAAALAALAALGAAFASRARAWRRGGWTAEEAAGRAYDAAAGERWEEALLWTRRARALAPTSVSLLLDEAFFLEELGRPREALPLYEEAASRSEDGEADFHAANVLLKLGAPTQEVAARFARCLARSPDFVHDLDDPAAPHHRALLSVPAFRDAVRAARRAERRERAR